jgi:hypothetical protein
MYYAVTLPTGLGGTVSCVGATCSYDSGSGAVTITGLPGTLTNGQTANITLSYIAPLSGDVHVTSTVSTTTSESNYGNNSSSTDTGVAGLTIVVKTNGTNNDTPPGPSTKSGPFLVQGSTVTWTYDVQNIANVTLTGVTVSDTKIGAICTIGTLAPGAIASCPPQTGTAVLGQYENIGIVTGTDPSNQTVTASNPDHYYGVVVCDVNGDGVINMLDMNLILAARGLKATVGDPRESFIDGMITINDANTCKLKCNKPNCAI